MELKTRGVQDILIACIDGPKGFPEAIAAEYPETRIQPCIVNMLRHSLKYVPWRGYKAVTADLHTLFDYPPEIRKAIYTSNIIEFLNRVIRCAVAHQKLFLSDELVMKVIYLAISLRRNGPCRSRIGALP